MNIYVTSNCPVESAKNLDDNSLIKMIKDSSQILSTVIMMNVEVPIELYNYSDIKTKKLKVICYYKGLHIPMPQRYTHPWVEWTDVTHSNYGWMFRFYHSLCKEFENRFEFKHVRSKLTNFFLTGSQLIEPGPLTTFVNCAANAELDIDYRDISDTIKAYKLFLCDKWELDPQESSWYKLEELKKELI